MLSGIAQSAKHLWARLTDAADQLRRVTRRAQSLVENAFLRHQLAVPHRQVKTLA